MGTTMACAQCHTHKYDPITQEEYFRFFALFNNTEDTDKKDERPVIELWSDAQKCEKERLRSQIEQLKKTLEAFIKTPINEHWDHLKELAELHQTEVLQELEDSMSEAIASTQKLEAEVKLNQAVLQSIDNSDKIIKAMQAKEKRDAKAA